LPDIAPWMKGLLESFDIVKLWSVVLQVIGMAIIARKTIMQSAVILSASFEREESRYRSHPHNPPPLSPQNSHYCFAVVIAGRAHIAL
jgi:hypothetical protein